MRIENGNIYFDAYISTNRVGSKVTTEVCMDLEDWLDMDNWQRNEAVWEQLSESGQFEWGWEPEVDDVKTKE